MTQVGLCDMYGWREILTENGINPDTVTEDEFEIVFEHYSDCDGCNKCCSTSWGYTDCNGCAYCCNCAEYRNDDPNNSEQYGCEHCSPEMFQ